jgi:hypothetical protein
VTCGGAEFVKPFVATIAQSRFGLEKKLHALEAIKKSVCNGHCEGPVCNLFEDELLPRGSAEN